MKTRNILLALGATGLVIIFVVGSLVDTRGDTARLADAASVGASPTITEPTTTLNSNGGDSLAHGAG